MAMAGQEAAIFPGADVWVESDAPGVYRRGVVMVTEEEEVPYAAIALPLPNALPCRNRLVMAHQVHR